MAINSARGESHEREVGRLLGKVEQNMTFLDKDDIKILEHLACKGDYPDKKAILISINS